MPLNGILHKKVVSRLTSKGASTAIAKIIADQTLDCTHSFTRWAILQRGAYLSPDEANELLRDIGVLVETENDNERL